MTKEDPPFDGQTKNDEENRVLTKYQKELTSIQQKSKLLCYNNNDDNDGDGEKAKSRPAPLPKFEYSELDTGRNVLGVGGFCTVYEIQGFTLNSTTSDGVVDDEEKNDGNDNEGEEQGFLYNLTRTLSKDQKEPSYKATMSNTTETRAYMAQNTFRGDKKDARYAIKILTPHVHSNKVKWRGMLDLAIEAEYLSVLSHPNVVKMRGLAQVHPLSTTAQPDPFFIMLDRLFGTLQERIDGSWTADRKIIKKMVKERGGFFGGIFGKNKVTEEDRKDWLRFLLERIKVASDISSAFCYIHSKGLIYRDIKSENIGFDVRGDVKIFDFGLIKELPPSYSKNSVYKFTSNTGSRPYMAPEVMLRKKYNQKADIYSFAILLYEIFELELPFHGFIKIDYISKVCNNNYRPKLKGGEGNSGGWPVLTKALLEECWDGDLKNRPDFDRIHSVLRAEMQDIASDLDDADSVKDRTAHLLNRSRTSFHNRIKRLNEKSSEHSA